MGLLRQVKGRVAGQLYGVADSLPWRRRILLKPYRAIYISVPKVACSSFKTAFADLLGVSLERAQGDPHRVRYPSPVPIEALEPFLYPGFYRFAFVRNPWDRLVSCYRDKIRNEVGGYTKFTIRPGVANCLARFDAFEAEMPFDAFVAAVASIPDSQADEHFRSQHTFLANRKGEIRGRLRRTLRKARWRLRDCPTANGPAGDRAASVAGRPESREVRFLLHRRDTEAGGRTVLEGHRDVRLRVRGMRRLGG